MMKVTAYTCLTLAYSLLEINAASKIPTLPEGGTGRIVGGVNVKIEDYPYQVSLQKGGVHFCGGSIINSSWVVTAAHCLYPDTKASDLTVAYGSTSWKRAIKAKVSSITIHPSYNSGTFDYDCAIMKLKAPLLMKRKRQGKNSVKAISLAAPGETILPGTQVIVSGWGLTVENGEKIPTTLQSVTVPLMSCEDCQAKYDGVTVLSKRMICAHEKNGGKDSCQGDSGGPLVTLVNNVMTLIGIVSWGYGCARPEYPGVYCSVSELNGWINEQMK